MINQYLSHSLTNNAKQNEWNERQEQYIKFLNNNLIRKLPLMTKLYVVNIFAVGYQNRVK